MPGRSGTRRAPHAVTSQAGSTPGMTDLPRGPQSGIKGDAHDREDLAHDEDLTSLSLASPGDADTSQMPYP
jgi:hypothetical protein